MPRLSATTVLLLSVAAVSCIGHLPPCPAAGGPAWTEVEGTRFRLRTDGDPASARAELAELEQFQTALLYVFGAPPDLDIGRLPVVVVDRGWTDFERRQVEGYYTHALFQPLVVMLAGGSFARQTVIKHELVHYVSAKIMPRQPLWLAEGLATYYETIDCDARTGKIIVGRPSSPRLSGARHTGVPTIEAMFAAKTTGDGYDEGRFYASAWLTVHYLMNHRPEALQRYERALHRGATADAAWSEAFGSETPAQIAADVHRYLDGGQYALRIYDLPRTKQAAPIERRLTDADVHATRALLHLTGRRSNDPPPRPPGEIAAQMADIKGEVDEALRQEPGHVLAGAITTFALGAPIDLGQATLAARTHGDDWMAWLLLAAVSRRSGDGPGFEAAMQRVVEIARGEGSVTIPVGFFRKP